MRSSWFWLVALVATACAVLSPGGAMAATTSPPSPPISHYVVYGEQGVFIGASSQVTGLVGANHNAPSGQGLGGVGYAIFMNGASKINGDARSGGNVDLQSSSGEITGTLIGPTGATLVNPGTIGTVATYDTVLLPTLPPATSFTCPTGGADDSGANGETRSLGPGTYGNFAFGSTFTLNLTAPGNYYFQSIHTANGAKINSAKGVHVFVCDDVNFGSVDVFPLTLTSFDLTFEVHSNDLENAFRAVGDSDWIGDVFTPYGGIHFGGSGGTFPAATFDGNFQGQHVDLEHAVGGHTDKAFKSGQKFNDLDGDHIKDPGEPGLPGWVIHLYGTDYNGNARHETATTDASGTYSFTVPAGNYTVCEQLQPGWQQTYPTSGADCTSGDSAADNPTPGPFGYSIVLAAGDDDTDNNFGNNEPPAAFSISGTKHQDTLQGVGLPGWHIRLYDTGGNQIGSDAITDPSGNYSFGPVGDDDYIVCEVLQTGWTQTAPTSGPSCFEPDEAPYGIAVTVGPDATGKDFANSLVRCEKQPVQAVLDPTSGRYPGNKGPDVFVYLSDAAPANSIQNAIDTVTDTNGDGYLIIQVLKDHTGQLGGSTSQRFTISQNYSMPFALIGCSNTLNNPTPSLPTEWIQSSANSTPKQGQPGTGNIFVMDVHGSGSTIAGVEVDGSGRELRNVYADNNNGVGYWITGSGNLIHNGEAVGNKGDGVYIQSSNNTMTDTDLYSNGGNGVNVNNGNNNQLLKLDAGDKGKGNTGDGIHVVGNSNTISEPDALANGGDGIDVSGAANIVTKAVAGDKGVGNGGDGIRVVYVGPGNSNNVNQSKASANKANGFELSGGTSGAPNILTSDVSNTANSGDASYENVGAEFKLANYVKNVSGGNKADNIVLPKTSSPTKCTTFPGTGASTNAAISCE